MEVVYKLWEGSWADDAVQRDRESGGFNLAFAVRPETFRDFVDFVVPELRKRGRYKTEYAQARCGRNSSAQGMIVWRRITKRQATGGAWRTTYDGHSPIFSRRSMGGFLREKRLEIRFPFNSFGGIFGSSWR